MCHFSSLCRCRKLTNFRDIFCCGCCCRCFLFFFHFCCNNKSNKKEVRQKKKNSAQRFYPWKEFAFSLLDESKNAADWQLWHLSPKTVSKAKKREMARERREKEKVCLPCGAKVAWNISNLSVKKTLQHALPFNILQFLLLLHLIFYFYVSVRRAR